jgi:protein tyrosine/serine phosphatase
MSETGEFKRSKLQMSRFRNTYVKLTALATLLVAFAAISTANTPENPAFAHIKIKNFGQMDERFYRGARPKENDFQDLKALGIQTVIDLTDNTPREKGYVEAQGMRYVNIAIPDKKDPTNAQITEFLNLVNDPATGKFYVHCAGGRHRTGVMGAVYRFNNYNWNYEQVYAEMKDFDFYTSNGHGGQKKFVESYAVRMQESAAAASQKN